jgi:hypothetical protein
MEPMRFRLGLIVGFAAGYYLGAKAGRQRYEQINTAITKARENHLLQKVIAAVDLSVERLRPEVSVDVRDAGSPSYN